MSWSVNAIGKIEAVTSAIAAQFNQISHLEDNEREIKDWAAALVARVLDLSPSDAAVDVLASGYACTNDQGQIYQRLQIDIHPVAGFVE
jgi:hypothetical protein